MNIKMKLRQEKLLELKEFARKINQKREIEKCLCEQLFESNIWHTSQIIAVYASMTHEFDTKQIVKQAWLDKKQVCFPKTYPKHTMEFFRVTEKTVFIKTAFGVNEPITDERIDVKEIDLIIVPGVAFQKSGYRIGYGGGFYDKFLMNYEGHTVSLVFPCQLLPENCSFHESFDQPIQALIMRK